ncbi:cell division protein PerM [Angustibacter luteus]|uniref:DUF6350 family protein n=1 Tax=Angustibacter luteus TaxID=658456 RepID=A0ABW1JFU0_9ACTN
MSLLDRLRNDSPPRASERASSTAAQERATTATMAALTGAATAALSWVAVVLPALLAWATSAQASATWGEAARVSTVLWLVVHRVQVLLPGGSVAFAPLGLTLVPIWLCWVAGRRVGSGLDRKTLTASTSPLRALAPVVAALAGGYAIVVTFAALVARTDGGGSSSGMLRPVLWQAAVFGFVLPLLAAGAGALGASGRTLERPLSALVADVVPVPPSFVRALRGALMATFSLLLCGAVLLTVTLAWHLDRILTLHRALDPGAVGGLVLSLGQLALIPNAAIWSVAFLAGPGVAFGAGSLVSAGGSSLGLLPLVPALGAVPAPGPLPTALWAVVLVPVVVGGLLGWWVAARSTPEPDPSAVDCIRAALTAAALAAGFLTVLMALSGGAAGPGALAEVGPSPWRVGLVLAGELAFGAAAVAWMTHRRISH